MTDQNPEDARRCWCGGFVGFRPDKGFIDCLADAGHDWRGKDGGLRRAASPIPIDAAYTRGFQDGARSQEPSEWARQQKAGAWEQGARAGHHSPLTWYALRKCNPFMRDGVNRGERDA